MMWLTETKFEIRLFTVLDYVSGILLLAIMTYLIRLCIRADHIEGLVWMVLDLVR